MLKKLLCRFGFHSWEKEPSKKELIRSTGIDFVFWSSGIQKGVRACTRQGCRAEQKVVREGWLGCGGTSEKWKRLSKRTERYIDSLPVL